MYGRRWHFLNGLKTPQSLNFDRHVMLVKLRQLSHQTSATRLANQHISLPESRMAIH